MRLNKYLALHTGISRRAADEAVRQNRVRVNGALPQNGYDVTEADIVILDGETVATATDVKTIILNKPAGYVCSRDGQGSETIYDLLPGELHELKSVGRLDKESSGLLLLTNDGELAHQLTHPSFQKTKQYRVRLSTALSPLHHQMINDIGITLEDGVSKLILESLDDNKKQWRITMREGRNRQIRRTFASLGYDVTELHRTNFGPYTLGDVVSGEYITC